MEWRPDEPYNALPSPPPAVELDELADRGVVRDLKIGRERLFINHRFLDILTRDDTGR